MDSYVDQLSRRATALIMLAKGNRSQQVTDTVNMAASTGSIGGPAWPFWRRVVIKRTECVEYPELGMGYLEN